MAPAGEAHGRAEEGGGAVGGLDAPLPADAGEPLPVGIVVNGQDRGCSALLLVVGGRPFVRAADLDACGVALPNAARRRQAGGASADDYLVLDGKAGMTARLDAGGTVLVLDIDAGAFASAQLGTQAERIPVATATPAAWIDYDLAFTDTEGLTAFSALLDMGVSGRWGVIEHGVLLGTGAVPNARLDTSYALDFPGSRLRLVLGDTLTRGSAWSQPARFGGIRFGTDFSLDPLRATFPLPTVQGGSVLPSTVELALGPQGVDGQRDFAVAPGMFSYSFRPTFNGAGEVTMSLRDIAGNQQVVSRSFYASDTQLRRGLSEFSVEAGALRQDYGLRSFAYGSLIAAGSLRHGVTSDLTLEARAESGGGVNMAGLGAQVVVQPLGEVRTAISVSRTGGRTGTLLQIQAQRLTRTYGITASYRQMDADWRQVGEVIDRDPLSGDPFGGGARRELAVSGSLFMGRFGSLGAGFFASRRGEEGGEVLSANYSVTLGRVFVNVGVQHRSAFGEGKSSNWLFGSLTLPFSGSRTLSLSADSDRTSVRYEKAVPTDTGLGYRVSAGQDYGGRRNTWAEGSATLRTAAGDIEAAALLRGADLSTRVAARGSLVAAGGTLAAAPRVGDAIAVVDLGGVEGADVLFENRRVPSLTGRDGTALVTGLVPYVPNRLAIDPSAVPIETVLDRAEQRVVPGRGKAVRVTFATSGAEPLRLAVHDTAGIPLPPGLKVSVQTFAGVAVASTVTGHGGEVFLEERGIARSLRIAQSAAPDGAGRACRVFLPELQAEFEAGQGLSRALDVTCVPEGAEP